MSIGHSAVDEIVKLKSLLDCGAITHDEFERLKDAVINGDSTTNDAQDTRLYSITLTEINADGFNENLAVLVLVSQVAEDETVKVDASKLPIYLAGGLTYNEAKAIQHKFRKLHSTIEISEDDNSDAHYDDLIVEDLFEPEESIITCPYCHSTNVEKITMGKKVRKGFFWGVAAASTLTKEWHCKNCKSNF